jgi:hypothetical protein
MVNIIGVRVSLDEVYEYFDDYILKELKNLYLENESIEVYMALDGIQVVIHRFYKKDEHTKAKSKSILFCISYVDLLSSDCYVSFLDEKMNLHLTKLREEVK